jgi:hypothetical protein
MALLYVKADEVTCNDTQQDTEDNVTEGTQSTPGVNTTGNVTSIF